MKTRPFVENDRQSIVEIHNAIWVDKATTSTEWANEERFRHGKNSSSQRFVLEIDKNIVAFGHISQISWLSRPQTLEIEINVHPNFQGKGYGKFLYDYLMQKVRENGATDLWAETKENQSRAIRFLNERGFSEKIRTFESILDVFSFDFTQYRGIIEQVEAQGYQITTIDKLVDDIDRNKKLYELDQILGQDIPTEEPMTSISFERFKERLFENKNLLPDAYFIALYQEKYVGMTVLWASQANSYLHNGLTGVINEHRRHKLALALKLKGIQYAKEHGFAKIYTFNNSINRPILSINEALGFVKQPAWINMNKKLDN